MDFENLCEVFGTTSEASVFEGHAFSTQDLMPFVNRNVQVSTKVPPSYDGKTSYFAYEDLIDEWCDVTNLEKDKWGPALRNRLEGEAYTYKDVLDRDKLKDPVKGVKYFKKTLRPYFVKGAESIFLWRFFQFVRFGRGHMEFLQWMTKMTVARRRLVEAWMDLLPDIPQPDYEAWICLLYTSPSPRDGLLSRMPSSA